MSSMRSGLMVALFLSRNMVTCSVSMQGMGVGRGGVEGGQCTDSVQRQTLS